MPPTEAEIKELTEEDIRNLERLAAAEEILYQKLLGFIYNLDPKQFRVSPAQFIRAEQVLVALAASGEIENFQRLRSYLAPLFSFSPAEKTSFDRQFEFWFKSLKENAPQVLAAEDEAAARQAATLLISEPVAPPEPPVLTLEGVRRRAKRLRREPQTFIIIAVICIFAAVFFLQPQIQKFINPPPPTPTVTPPTTPPTPKTDPVAGRQFLFSAAHRRRRFSFSGVGRLAGLVEIYPPAVSEKMA